MLLRYKGKRMKCANCGCREVDCENKIKTLVEINKLSHKEIMLLHKRERREKINSLGFYLILISSFVLELLVNHG